MKNLKKLYFSEEEKRKGLNYLDLGTWGSFYAEYIIPDEHKLCGWWYSQDGKVWAAVYYVPSELEAGAETDPLSIDGVLACDFLDVGWDMWIITAESEQT